MMVMVMMVMMMVVMMKVMMMVMMSDDGMMMMMSHGYNIGETHEAHPDPGHVLCKVRGVDPPSRPWEAACRWGARVFQAPSQIEDENGVKKQTDEHLAMTVLRQLGRRSLSGLSVVQEPRGDQAPAEPRQPRHRAGRMDVGDMLTMDSLGTQTLLWTYRHGNQNEVSAMTDTSSRAGASGILQKY
uniref:Uncharacterized protein n=1 Tax=Knipowitschia caucasica TaxID=637954 RepID=A0AAV2KGS9_KNICA